MPPPPAPDHPPPAAPLLAYAKRSTHYGVAIIREPGLVRVILPVIRLRNAIVGCLGICVVPVSHAVMLWIQDKTHVGPYIAIAALVILAILSRSWRQVFEVDAESVKVGRIFGRGISYTSVWPRQSVGEIRYSTINGNLLIRITGRDLLEYPLPGDPPHQIRNRRGAAGGAGAGEEWGATPDRFWS